MGLLLTTLFGRMMALRRRHEQAGPARGPCLRSVGQRDRRGPAGFAEERQTPGQLDRPEHGVVRGWTSETGGRLHPRADDDRGDMAAALFVAGALVPGDEQDRPRECRRADYPRPEHLQE